MALPHSSPSPLSSSASPSAAASSTVEYSKVRSSDPEDPTFEIEDPKAPTKSFYGKAPASSSSPFLHDRCSRSALACLAAIIAGTCLLLLLGIHVLTKPAAVPAREPDSNAIPALSPNPPPVDEAFSPSYDSSPSSSSSPSPSPLPSSPSPSPTSSAPGVVLSLASLCNATQDSGFCGETLGSYPGSEGEAASLTDLTGYVVSAAMEAVNRTYELGRDLFETRNGTRGELAVLQDCVELLDQSMDALKDSRDLLRHLDVASRGQVMDVRVGLSTAYTDQDTCWDEFGDLGGGKVADRMSKEGGSIAPLLSLALSFALTVQNHSPAAVYIPLLAPSPSP